MGRFKALICGASNLRRYQKIESNDQENTTKDYYCYKCAECGHRGKAKVSKDIFFCLLKNPLGINSNFKCKQF